MTDADATARPQATPETASQPADQSALRSDPDPAPEPLDKTYAPGQVEPDIRQRWLHARAFHADPHRNAQGQPEGQPFSILIPPPNVTAALHLGHAFNNTIQDVLARYHRMRGDRTLWMPGTDHAGIATQTVVEKRLLHSEGKRRTDYPRDEFVRRVQAWKDEYEQRIVDQLNALGASCDYDRQRFTMDPVCAKAVRWAFVRLFEDGLIYRGKRLVNWDPQTQTALADDEVEMETIDGNFYYMKYPVCDAQGNTNGQFVTVATTRPETMLGDTAVAVNPNDTTPAPGWPNGRAAMAGGHVLLPIVNRVIPIVADDYVVVPAADPDPTDTADAKAKNDAADAKDAAESDVKARYASGFLKVTPAHDPNDYEIGRRHNLPVINVMAPDASISHDYGWSEVEMNIAEAETFVGLSREEARKAIVRWFKEHDLLDEVRPYRHAVGHSYRSHVPIEPYLSDQWYVKVTDDRLAGAALRAMAPDQRQADTDGCVWKQGDPFADPAPRPQPRTPNPFNKPPIPQPARPRPELRFTPPRYAKTFQTWHENIRDWCISRQLWWGHRIPVWHRTCTFVNGELQDEALYQMIHRVQRSDNSAVVITPVGRWEPMEGYYPGTLVSWRDDITLPDGEFDVYVAVADEDRFWNHEHGNLGEHPRRDLEAIGFVQDEDVLDTWFSSALWPLSTMGWPFPEDFPQAIPEGRALLDTFNPTSVLCTAREIITLWVSRMVMFNLYFTALPQPGEADAPAAAARAHLPFNDVFIHAMIQDGHGQKMSKSLGNGVDPFDIIHSHGADACRFTLTQMCTQTQDVRMPVDMVDPHTGKTFTPRYETLPNGYKVAAPLQDSPSEKHADGSPRRMVSSYGVASGKAEPGTDERGHDLPAARNTSEKFDLGRNFANKLWNASRFVLGILEEAGPPAGRTGIRLALPDRWVLSRAVAAIGDAERHIDEYEFHHLANRLYGFVWHDLCDWYIESVKADIRDPQRGAVSRQVLATVLDIALRLLHPVMPFITERLWASLNAVTPHRGVAGLDPDTESQAAALLATAPWPREGRHYDRATIDREAERIFDAVREIVGMIREVRANAKLPPRQTVEASIKVDAQLADTLRDEMRLVETLSNTRILAAGPDVPKPVSAAVVTRPMGELYLHIEVDTESERERQSKRAEDLRKSIKTLQGRLANKGYTDKAPAHLVQQTRDELAAAQAELDRIEQATA